MSGLPWVIIGIAVGLILIGILLAVTLKRKREGNSKGINYRVLFILGISFTPLGFIYLITFFVSAKTVFLVLGLSFIGTGLSYLAIGLSNKDKWKKK